MVWVPIPCKRSDLSLQVVLMCGQSFRWQTVESGVYRSVLGDHVISLKQDDDQIFYKLHDDQIHSQSVNKPNIEQLLKDYFQLHVSTSELFKQWAKTDENFRGLYKNFSGIRVLRQEPVENLFSFICSSNNNIVRISQMVEKLATHFGRKLMRVNDADYYTFPSVESLTGEDVEGKLRGLGFGYRAKYIVHSARFIVEQGGESWLYGLRNKSYDEAKGELLRLMGVGEKVADCVLLMSLDKAGAIPIDTHIAAVARQYYLSNLPSTKTVTVAVYKQIGDHLRGLWGEYAGWAQAVVFSADLPKFKLTNQSQVESEKKALKRKKSGT